MKDIYKYSKDDAFRFAHEQNAITRIHGNELQFKFCPYCHSPKDTYRFSINLETGQFKCLRASCGAHGNMLTLHKDFNFDLGTEVREYEEPSYRWRRFKRPEKPIVPDEPAIKYLTGRGISKEVIEKYQIKSKKGDENRIAFPFFDENGDLQFIKYRYIDTSKTKDGRKEDCEPHCKAILFGMMQCEPDKPLIITEGQIDSLSVATAGIPNAVSVPTGKNGMTWVPHCWDWMQQWKTIIVFGDYEHGSMTLLSDIKARFDCEIRAVRPEAYKGCKDANELLQKFGVDAVRKAVETARAEMPAEIKRLCDVPYNSQDDERLSVGIKEIDDVLEGGLPFGYMNILTGKRGEGKSTFGSMLAKSALEHGYNTFIYSGEMREGDVRIWLDRQIAGQNRISVEDVGGYRKYSLSNPIVEDIAHWYQDKAYIYDTEYISESGQDLLKTVERSIREMGCRFILIDNLMTAIDICRIDSQMDKYDRQSSICKAFARMAQTYNVMIVLIAHKKKGFEADENDDVLGSSEITNLAGVVMSYGRSQDVGEDERVIRISKNRLNGHLTASEGVCVGFDDASKRVYGMDKTDPGPNDNSVCFEDSDGFVPTGDMEEIPFGD
jgi:hypothetical protein